MTTPRPLPARHLMETAHKLLERTAFSSFVLPEVRAAVAQMEAACTVLYLTAKATCEELIRSHGKSPVAVNVVSDADAMRQVAPAHRPAFSAAMGTARAAGEHVLIAATSDGVIRLESFKPNAEWFCPFPWIVDNN